MLYYPLSSLSGILQCKLEVLTKIKRYCMAKSFSYMYLPAHYRNKNSNIHICKTNYFPLIETSIEEEIYLDAKLRFGKNLKQALYVIASQL